MKSAIEQLSRQLYIVNRLLRSKEPVATDVLLGDIGRQCEIRSYAFPMEHKSKMRLLQRDKAIEEMFYITIANRRGLGLESVEVNKEGFTTNAEQKYCLSMASGWLLSRTVTLAHRRNLTVIIITTLRSFAIS